MAPQQPQIKARVEITNADAILRGLNSRFQGGIMPALQKAKEIVETKFTQNPAGWVPLSQYTVLDRKRKGFGPTPMLYRTGHLMGQAVQQIAQDSPTEGHISTQDPIALVQNNGGGKIPARPFYSLSDTDKAAIFEAFKNGIK